MTSAGSQSTLEQRLEDWIPQIVNFGFSKEQAKEAITVTDGTSLELAVSYLFDNAHAQQEFKESSSATQIGYKMVICVRTDLKMGTGKIAAQAAHGAVAMVMKMMSTSSKHLDLWIREGQKKICLKINSEEKLEELKRSAVKLGIPQTSIQDAGKTQVKAGTTTVLVVGPAPSKDVDKVTGNLKLL
ncbi:hypothetical protein AAMO2058_001226700 [Amorphochlora amoebiformis]